jgi:predicted alpha/beta-fold hydrolase
VASSQIKTQTFRARRGLSGGHRQTLASFFLPRRIDLPSAQKRLVEVEAGVHVLCHCHWQHDPQRALTIIAVHGLEGSTESKYMLGIAHKGLAAGMNVVLMNQRNCGGTDALAPTLYHSGRSHDVATVAQNLMQQDRISRFALVGFSMGGNLVLKTAGEWGGTGPAQFRAVAAVCPAVDLAASADALHLRSNRLYEYYFLWKLRRRLRAKAHLFPGSFDVSRMRCIRTLRDFDDKVTAYYCGFQGAADYYARAAAACVIGRITAPTLILHALNDPFIRILPETRARILSNPNITFVETKDGGHCSFIAEASGGDGNGTEIKGYDGRWAELQVIEFLKQF